MTMSRRLPTNPRNEKDRARGKLSRAIHSGKIKPGVCEVCGSPDTQAHHADYSKPLEVKWLCSLHHKEDPNAASK